MFEREGLRVGVVAEAAITYEGAPHRPFKVVTGERAADATDPEYFDIACRRISETHAQRDFFVKKAV